MRRILGKRANNKLNKLLKNDNSVEAAYYLPTIFGDHEVFHIQHDLLMELVDTLESLYHEEDVVEYCRMAIPYLQKKISEYYIERDKAAKNLSRFSRPSSNPLWSKHEREATGYNYECVVSTLERLDAKYIYSQYDTGYYYQQYVLWSWLLSQFEYYISVTH